MTSYRSGIREHSQTQAYEVFRFRKTAIWKGIGKGLLTIGIGAGIVIFAAVRMEISTRQPMFWYGLFGGPAIVIIPIGWWSWRRARREDEIHRQFQQAPSMPLRLARDHDDAWIEGKIRCPRPLRPPHHSHRCSWYHLVVKEKRGSGKNSRWVTILDQTRRTRVWITDGTREIEVHMPKASIDYPIASSRRSGRKRYTLRRLPSAGHISACGVVRYRKDVRGKQREKVIELDKVDEPGEETEHAIEARGPVDPEKDLPQTKAFETWRPHHEKSQVKEERRTVRRSRRRRRRRIRRLRRKPREERNPAGRFLSRREPKDEWHLTSLDDTHGVPKDKRLMLTAHRHVPLMVTPLRRANWHDRSEADELTTTIYADVTLAYSIPAFIWALGYYLKWWGLAWVPGVPIGLAVMLGLLVPSKIVGRYNRFVIYRRRIPNARSYLDVDLKMRADLIPQLVNVVTAYAQHEKGVQEHLTQIRREAEAGDDVTRSLFALREAYPDLDAQANFELLYDDITALEEKIAFGRALLRDTITEYNNTIEAFPSSILAAMTGFKSEPLPRG